MAAKKQNDSLGEKEQISRSQQEPIVSDDDFGLDDIDLDLISESESEEGVSPSPIAVRKCEEEEKKNRTAILITILVVLLVLAALYFFVIKSEPEPEPEPEPVKQEQPVQLQPEPEPEPEPESEPPKEPQVITITQRDSRFYVVVGSFFDSDGAEDRADSIVASGTDAYVIQPLGNLQYYRVGISPSGSFSEANGLLEGLKATYGEKIWVLKH